MHPLSPENIEAELSYAYIHAVASHAGVACSVAGRHEDNAGVDANLIGWGPFPGGGYRKEIDVKVQLKATIKKPAFIKDCYSYNLLGIDRYDDLRSDALATPRILVVLYLPAVRGGWLTQTDDALSLRNCAYWVSLRGAGPSSNATSQTVYLPRSQRFDVAGLLGLMGSISAGSVPTYSGIES